MKKLDMKNRQNAYEAQFGAHIKTIKNVIDLGLKEAKDSNWQKYYFSFLVAEPPLPQKAHVDIYNELEKKGWAIKPAYKLDDKRLVGFVIDLSGENK